MQELILSTRVVGANGDGDGDSSLSGGAVRNTSDRRTDPNMSCIRERERKYWDRCLFQSLGMSEKTRVEREREGGKKVGKIVFRK